MAGRPPAVHEQVAAMLLRDGKDRRERAGTCERDERIERQHGADQPQLGAAFELLGRPGDVGGRQRRKP
jgi:hypothetical protein